MVRKKAHDIKEQFTYTLSDLRLFFRDFYYYISRKLKIIGTYFELVKGFLVTLLITKRGRYHGSFLNVSMVVLMISAILLAPFISSYYPLLGSSETISAIEPPSASIAQLNLEGMSMATTESEKPRDQILDYAVKEGDTVSTISKKFAVSEDTIKWANDLDGKNPVLKVGQILKISPVTGVVHKVKRGDTIYSIAKKYQTEAQNIVNFPFNDFVDLENFTLTVGQTLIVPEGIIEDEKAPLIPRPSAPQYLAKQSLGQFLWPTSGYVSQQPVWYHMALDIANKSAPDVYAVENGTVTMATCLKWGYGCHMVVDHGGGIQTLYAHLSEFYASAGAKVARGSAIAKMGSTGRSTGTHLHLEVRVNGSVVNPWPYFK